MFHVDNRGSMLIISCAVAFLSILIIVALFYFLGGIHQKKYRVKRSAVSQPEPPAPAISIQQDDQSELVAVITAAITAARGGNDQFNILNIQRRKKRHATWNSAGLSQNIKGLASHK